MKNLTIKSATVFWKLPHLDAFRHLGIGVNENDIRANKYFNISHVPRCLWLYLRNIEETVLQLICTKK